MERSETREGRSGSRESAESALGRFVFRFVVVYLSLFILATQVSGSLFQFPGVTFRGLGPLPPMREITFWLAAHAFQVPGPYVHTGTDGETIFFWIQTLWILVLAAAAAAAWSFLGRRTASAGLKKWFRVFVRFALASQMFEYGMTKIIPTQFPPPSLNILVTPAGSLSLGTMLWTTIGSSTPYEIFTGCAELLGGVLLLAPRTTTLGALICFADMFHVFVLNMSFDIGLKLVSLHLAMLALFLLWAERGRLLNVLLLNRPAPASEEPELFASAPANRLALIVQIGFGVYLIAMFAWINASFWYAAGGGSPRSPLYGIWDVETLSIDGEVRPPSLNDYDRRWRRAIFDKPGTMSFQRTDDSFARFGVSIDEYNKTFALTKGGSRTWKSTFSFEQPSPDRLVLEGEMDQHRVRAELRLVEADTFRLLNSHFRWVRPPDP